MKRLPIILLAISVSALAVMFTSFTPPSASAALTRVCPSAAPPVSHWIDTCPAGTDTLPDSEARVGIDNTGPSGPDCVVDTVISLSGAADIDRDAGQNATTPHSIDTEIVDMTLTGSGFTMKVGTSTPGINAGVSASLGAIEEQSGDATLGDSFFDVFFEIDDGTNKLYNLSALRLEQVIDQVPPDADYVHKLPGELPEDLCIDLFTAPSGGSDTGVNLVSAIHCTVGPCNGVGGIAEVLAGGSHSPASASAGSGLSALTYAGLAGAVAAVMIAVAAGGWYARRRFR